MSDSQRKILDVTAELMNERGYHGASIQAIADRVQITKSTIFHHFQNKEGILLAILEEVVPVAVQGIKEITDDDSLSGMEKLRKFVRYQMKVVHEKGPVMNLYMAESRHLSKASKDKYLQSQRQYVRSFLKIIQQIRKENPECWKEIDDAIVAYAILGMCNWPINWYSKDGKLSHEEIAEQFYRIIVESLC